MRRGRIEWRAGTEKHLREAATADTLPYHDPQLAPRDEAIFLLHTASEIEHALMVQYLYAAFTLDLRNSGPARQWRGTLLLVAKEEMGHLMTVQNLLRLIGGPLNFEREDWPFRSEFYPFAFKLEPLTIAAPVGAAGAMSAAERADSLDRAGSLNRYIAAEMPPKEQVDGADEADLERILGSLDGGINRVGALYRRLIELFSAAPAGDPETAKRHLHDDDFFADTASYQATDGLWVSGQMLVMGAGTRSQAVDALAAIAEQGEAPGHAGPQNPGAASAASMSHFKRLLAIYKGIESERVRLSKPGWQPGLPVPVNPTSMRAEQAASAGLTPITNPAARRWAQLFDLRYRLLLGFLQHYLLINEAEKRDALADFAINEMLDLSSLARVLVQRPLGEPAGKRHAAPAFALPYTLQLPDREIDRARTHSATIAASALLIKAIREGEKPTLPEDDLSVLEFLEQRDEAMTRRFEAWNEIASAMTKQVAVTRAAEAAPTSFERDIKPLFNELDVQHMNGQDPQVDPGLRFDLASYNDVKSRARSILRRLKRRDSGMMPPADQGGPWPPEKIDLFKTWIDEGCPP